MTLNVISLGQGETDNKVKQTQMITISNPLSHKWFTIGSYLGPDPSALIWSDHFNDKNYQWSLNSDYTQKCS